MEIEIPELDDERMLRHVGLEAGKGLYTLRMWDTNRYHKRGTSLIGYAFYAPGAEDANLAPLFVGEDYSNSPMHAVDSDDTVRGLLGFITLKPGDTDREYFAEYTEEQMAFARGDAEELSMYSLEEDPLEWKNLDDWDEYQDAEDEDEEDDPLPVVVTFTEVNGHTDIGPEFARFGPDGVFALHGGDWGSVERVFEVLAETLFGAMATHEPGDIVSLKFNVTDKATGEVLHTVAIESAPWKVQP